MPTLADDRDDGARTLRASLKGFEETPSISSTGRGTFRATISEDGTSRAFLMSIRRHQRPCRECPDNQTARRHDRELESEIGTGSRTVKSAGKERDGCAVRVWLYCQWVVGKRVHARERRVHVDGAR